MYLGPM